MDLKQGQQSVLEKFIQDVRLLPEILNPSIRWSESSISGSKAAIGTFFLSTEWLSMQQVEISWKEAHSKIVEIYVNTAASEAAFLAENFPGIILWRTTISLDRESWKQEIEKLRAIVNDMTGSLVVARLSRNGLRINSVYGPSSVRRYMLEWLEDFGKAAETAFSYSQESIMAAFDAELEKYGRNDSSNFIPHPDPNSLVATLVNKKYELIYDFPIIQEGIRLVNAAIAWVMPFVMFYARTRDTSYKPLTRALFTIAFVDQYFWRHEKHPTNIVDRFAIDADRIDETALMGPSQANITKRTAYEVRVSAALSYGDPFVMEIRPGVSASRIRSGPIVLSTDGPLDRDVIAVHIPAILRIISTYYSDYGSTDVDTFDSGSLEEAKNMIADSTSTVLMATRQARSLKQLLEQLIQAGFLPHVCRIYDSALKSEFTKKRYRNDDNDSDDLVIFNEVQQAIGCISALGNTAFGLAETYGPGLDYMENYLYATGQADSIWDDYYKALGFGDGALASILNRSMAPRTYTEYIKSTRTILLQDICSSEKHSSDSADRISGGNSTRDSFLLWFDRNAWERWGIVSPKTEKLSCTNEDLWKEDILLDVAGSSDSVKLSSLSECIMISAAASAQYPKSAPDRAELKSPAFAKYVAASVCLDALMSLASAAFTAPHITVAINVLTWAREYGGSEIGNFNDHKAKLNALIYALLPFSGSDPQAPTVNDAGNMESLLGDLHTVVSQAIANIPIAARPIIPRRPTHINSTFLLSMYATALRLHLDSFVQRTRKVSDSLSIVAWSLTDSMSVLKAFFSATFSAEQLPSIVTIYTMGENGKEVIGSWDIRDIISAITDCFDDCADAVASARVNSVTLRALIQETSTSATFCKTLFERTENGSSEKHINVNSTSEFTARDVYYKLFHDFQELQKIQTQLDIQLRKVTVGGTVPPGLRSIETFLKLTGDLSSIMDSAADDPGKFFRKALDSAIRVWREAEKLRLEAAAGLSDNTTEQIPVAVSDMMDGYEERGADDIGTLFRISKKYNISSLSQVDTRPLRVDTIGIESSDVDATSDAMLLHKFVSGTDLIRIVDGIFHSQDVDSIQKVQL